MPSLTGFRESTGSWAGLLRDCRRGMSAPTPDVDDGALGFWKAVRECVPGRPRATVLVSQAGKYLAALPKSAHPAVKAFEVDFGAKHPKMVAKIVDDLNVLLEFYQYPAEHWIHLRTTDQIESTFATVRRRTKVARGPRSHAGGITLARKVIDAAQARWRGVNAPHRVGVVFHKGKLPERPVDITPPNSPADEDRTTGSQVA